MRPVLVILVTIFLVCCKGKNDLPDGIMKPEKMQKVFWDYLRADVYTTDFISKDSTKNMILENLKLQEKIFALHKTTREEFYKSYTYYSNHKELMTKMLDSMIVKHQRKMPEAKPVQTKKSL